MGKPITEPTDPTLTNIVKLALEVWLQVYGPDVVEIVEDWIKETKEPALKASPILRLIRREEH